VSVYSINLPGFGFCPGRADQPSGSCVRIYNHGSDERQNFCQEKVSDTVEKVSLMARLFYGSTLNRC
jgi:hypothetical protein